MNKVRLAMTAICFAIMSLAVVGCGKDPVKNESYTGVPTDGKSCEQAYVLKANQAKCVQQDGRGR